MPSGILQRPKNMQEEALIEHILRVKAAGAGANAEIFAALQAEGLAVELKDVKKAASKAAKRGVLPPVPTVAPAPATEEPAPVSAKAAKKAAMQEKNAAAELKAQEAIMMESQRKLRTAKSGGGLSDKVHIEGTMEQFIQQITTRAISGILEKGDETVLRERIDADIAAIEWCKLAQKQGALSFKEDVVALGGELQLKRLKEVRDAKWDFNAAMACYAHGVSGGEGYAGVDRMVAASRKSDGEFVSDEQD